jgi:uncharacterized protein
MKQLTKPFYLALGWLCVGLGIIGVILPILPTTPFLIVAVWAFSRSSPRIAKAIRDNPTIGPFIVDWETHGIIPKRAKALAVAAMTFSFGGMLFFTALPVIAIAGLGAVMISVGAYILTRPSSKP